MRRVLTVTYGVLEPERVESDTRAAPIAEETAYRAIQQRCDHCCIWQDWAGACNRPMHPCAYQTTDSLAQEGLLAIWELFRNEVG